MPVLNQTIEGIIKTYVGFNMNRVTLRTALSNRTRAEVLHSVLQIGDSTSSDEFCEPSAKERWRQLHESLMAMLMKG